MGRAKEKKEIWGDVLTEKGYMRVPRALRLRRVELGISNIEYTILLDYLDYYTYCGTQNPYKHLAEVNGISERSVKITLGNLERKGLIGRSVKKDPSGRTNGVVFSIEPLLQKLGGRVKDFSPTEGEKNFTYVGEEKLTLTTREECNKKQDNKKRSSSSTALIREDSKPEGINISDSDGYGGESLREVRERYVLTGARMELVNPPPVSALNEPTGLAPGEETQSGDIDLPIEQTAKNSSVDPYSSTKWYNEVFSALYEEAAGQPVLTGGREYKAAQMYFRRLKELNPSMGPGEIYERASEGAEFMLESQLTGGVFGWMHRPPDICMLSSQAQAADYHLRKTVITIKGAQRDSQTNQVNLPARSVAREKEADYASEEITRLYGELRGIGRAAE